MKILIVDDSSDGRRILRYLVEQHGHQVIEAKNGQEGLVMAESHHPDLIISDVLMPVMDGFQFLRNLKKEASFRAIPFIFYSATYAEEQDVQLGLSLGADRYIIKPKDPEEIWHEVERVMEKPRAEKAIPADLIGGENAHLERYSHVVALKLEEKVRQLEETQKERERAEAALRESEKKFITIFKAVPALLGISVLTDGRLVEVNETFLRAVGYERDEVIGRSTIELGLWADPGERATIVRTLQEQRFIRDREVRFRDRSGNIFIGLLSAEIIEFGGEQHMLTMVKDITVRKLMEEEIERLNTRLAARAAELEEANRELETFGYTVAHDLRKPLTVINGYCQTIKEICADQLGEECAGYLQEAYQGTLRMNRLIDALLNFSLGRREPLREVVDMSAIAREAAAELRQSEPERRVVFRIADGVVANGDPNLLQVVIGNLFGNAWKFTGIREEAFIEFGSTEIRGKQTIFVRDNGIGFDMSDAARIFAPFERIKTAGDVGGIGIGLATVQRIVKRHGGKVWAEGEPGKGAAFYFTLAP